MKGRWLVRLLRRFADWADSIYVVTHWARLWLWGIPVLAIPIGWKIVRVPDATEEKLQRLLDELED